MAHPSTDPTFYRTAAQAAAAPGEQLAYVAAFDRAAKMNDAMTVVDVNPASESYGRVVGWTGVPGRGDELHHFGWNACSSALKHEGHDMSGLQRRYLLVPGLRSSTMHVFDTQPDPRSPRLIKTIDGKVLSENAGYSRPHTLHCGPDGVFLTCLGGPEGNDDGPGGIALLDPRDVRRVACLGDRPRATALPLRRLVAPQSERLDLQRVGQPLDDRRRHRAGIIAGPKVWARHPFLGSRHG
jgi:selenium-binding protein 1